MEFRGDDRGVSTVVGVTLVFGFVVILLAINQSAVVPSENEQVEFAHSQRVATDMVSVRNAVLETKETGEDRFVTVELGTTYPARVLAINPPPPVGTLRTTGNQSFTVEEAGSDVTSNVCPGGTNTRLLVYDPGYNVYRGPEVVYENSVVYKQFPDGNVTMTRQTLVRGDTIDLVPVQNQFSESGVDAVSFESRAGQLDTTEVTDPTLTLPTRLPNSTWVDLLEGEVAPGNVGVSGGSVTIDLSGTYTINCGPVGTNDAPPGGERGDEATDINPAGPGDVRVVNGTFQGGNDPVVDVVFNNSDRSATNVTAARVSFFFNSGGPGGFSPVTLRNESTGNAVASLEIGGSRSVLSTEIRLASRSNTTLEFEFSQSVQSGDFFIVVLTFSNGGSGTYFVAPQSA